MATIYSKLDAKDYARENMRGIWAAALNPFADDLSLDEAGLRANIRHWIDDLDIQGLFIAGKQGEFFSMSLDERKRNFEIAVEECGGKAGVIVSVSDQNFDTVLDLVSPRTKLRGRLHRGSCARIEFHTRSRRSPVSVLQGPV